MLDRRNWILTCLVAALAASSGEAWGETSLEGITSEGISSQEFSDFASLTGASGAGASGTGTQTEKIVGSDSVSPSPQEIVTLGKLVSLEGPGSQQGLFRSVGKGEELQFTSPEIWDDSMGRRDRRLILPRLSMMSHEPYTDYRRSESIFSYLPGSGDDLGWIDIESDHYLESGYRSGFSTGIGIHLLSGPRVVEAPPRLYSVTLGYQRRDAIGEAFSYDIAGSIGIFSDFEGSVREGFRFPGHAVGMFHQSPELDWVFGLDFLDRDDISLQPVFGVSIHAQRLENIRFDLVFPRPQIEYAMQSGRVVYVAGRLGGDSWDMEFENGREDVLTYRETQLLLGTRRRGGRTGNAIEVGYSYNRRLDFEHFHCAAEPGGAFLLRFVSAL